MSGSIPTSSIPDTGSYPITHFLSNIGLVAYLARKQQEVGMLVRESQLPRDCKLVCVYLLWVGSPSRMKAMNKGSRLTLSVRGNDKPPLATARERPGLGTYFEHEHHHVMRQLQLNPTQTEQALPKHGRTTRRDVGVRDPSNECKIQTDPDRRHRLLFLPDQPRLLPPNINKQQRQYDRTRI